MPKTDLATTILGILDGPGDPNNKIVAARAACRAPAGDSDPYAKKPIETIPPTPPKAEAKASEAASEAASEKKKKK